MSSSLAERFLDARGEPPPELAAALPQVRGLLEAALREGRRAWPQISLEDRVFVAHLAACLPREWAAVPAALAALHAADLYLACACACGRPAALVALNRDFLRPLPRQLRLAEQEDDELLQDLREHLLTGAAPRIANYSGSGPLRRYLQVAAQRLWLHKRRSMDAQVEERGLRDLTEGLAAGVDLEREHLIRHSKPEIEAAFQAALASLPEAQRLLLKLHYVERFTERGMAPMLGKSQPTVHRELVAARRALIVEVRRRCAARLGLPESRLDSLVDEVYSHLELHLSQLLPREDESPIKAPDAAR